MQLHPARSAMAMEESHIVSINVILIQAESSGKPLPFYETTRTNRRKRIYEAVKPKNYYHLEYQLQPGATSPTFSTDIVTYGIVTKVFTNQDERLIRSWSEDGLVYHGWKHNHKVTLDTDSLLELYSHTFSVRLWNSPDKVSARARYDRPKAFRLPMSKRDPKDNKLHFPGVYHDLSTTSVKIARHRSRRLSEQIDLEGIDDSMECLASQKSQTMPSIIEEIHFEEKNDPISNTHVNFSQTQVNASSQSTLTSASLTPGLRGLSKQQIKLLQDESNERERINKEGLVVISIKLADLFGSDHSAKATLKECKGDLKYFEVIVSLDSPLMSDKQRMLLNPMTITIKDCTLPPFKECQRSDVHVKYQFFNKPIVTTESLPYSGALAWNSSNVLLLGTIVPELLLEYLRGPPLFFEMHIHDTDSLESTIKQPEGAIFGQILHDLTLGTCNCSDANDEKGENRIVPGAKFDLSALLTGVTTMEFTLPVLNSTSYMMKELSKSNMDYINYESQITVIVHLTFPLSFAPLSLHEDDVLSQRPMTPFGRLVYMVSTANSQLVERLVALISEINASELNLLDKTPAERNAILSTYKLTEEQLNSSQCNVITGFHLEDTDNHIFMIEGLHGKGILKIWEAIPHQSTQDEVVKAFYDSDYSFSKRIYGKLDVDLVHITLPQSLQEIMKEPTVYLHESIPKLCFIALQNIHDLIFAQDFCSIIRNDMFPSFDMISSLSVYCLQLIPTKTEIIEEESLATLISVPKSKSKRNLETLDNVNYKYEDLLEERKQLPEPDKITHNILKVQQMSDEVKKTKKFHRRSTSEGNKPTAVYSSQTYNSAVLNKAILRQKLDSKSRYTYCQHYHSMTVEPVDVEKELQFYWQRGSRSKWISDQDFVFPGPKTALQDNAHPKGVHISRREELKQKFCDNLLHSNKLQPSVDWMKFSWDNRAHDFDCYRQPPKYFGSHYPATIHLAGECRNTEMKSFKEKEQERWRTKMVVDNMQFYTLRQGIKTEQGLRAASQQDKLKSLLKDDPDIPSAIAPTEHLRVDTLPALATIRNNEREKGLIGYVPGDIALCKSLKHDCNVIPIYKQLPTQ